MRKRRETGVKRRGGIAVSYNGYADRPAERMHIVLDAEPTGLALEYRAKGNLVIGSQIRLSRVAATRLGLALLNWAAQPGLPEIAGMSAPPTPPRVDAGAPPAAASPHAVAGPRLCRSRV